MKNRWNNNYLSNVYSELKQKEIKKLILDKDSSFGDCSNDRTSFHYVLGREYYHFKAKEMSVGVLIEFDNSNVICSGKRGDLEMLEGIAFFNIEPKAKEDAWKKDSLFSKVEYGVD